MKFLLAVIVSMLTLLSGCTASVDAGTVGVVVKKPYFLGSGGVDPEVLLPGRTFLAPSSEVIAYASTPRRVSEDFHDLITKGNGPVTFQAFMIYHIDPQQAPNLHQNFGPDFYANNLQQPFRTMVRDFARGHTPTELTTDVTVTSDGQAKILKEVVARVKKEKIPIIVDDVVIGAVSPPKEVIEETSRTQAQNQRAQTETSRAAAELNRKNAEQNKALADKAYAVTFGMTPQEFLMYRNLENQREMIGVVKDKANANVLVQLGGGSAMPTLQMGK